MPFVELTIRIPQALADEAKVFDLLRDERLSETAKAVSEAASEKYGSLSDDEVMGLVNEEIKMMRAEERAKETLAKTDEA